MVRRAGAGVEEVPGEGVQRVQCRGGPTVAMRSIRADREPARVRSVGERREGGRADRAGSEKEGAQAWSYAHGLEPHSASRGGGHDSPAPRAVSAVSRKKEANLARGRFLSPLGEKEEGGPGGQPGEQWFPQARVTVLPGTASPERVEATEYVDLENSPGDGLTLGGEAMADGLAEIEKFCDEV